MTGASSGIEPLLENPLVCSIVRSPQMLVRRALFRLLWPLLALSTYSNVVINEIHYNPAVKTELVEFIELYNNSSAEVDVSGWKFTSGIEYTFPDGTKIAANGYLVIAQNPNALKAKYGANSLGPWTGILSNQGDTLTLRDGAGDVINKVEYQLGFPWPTVGDPPGYSIELVNPSFDNDLGGNWRPSVKGTPVSQEQTLFPSGSTWKYLKGTTEASNPTSAWRALNFDDSTWDSGGAPIGYDPAIPMGTSLPDMRYNYTSVFLRKNFQVSDPASISSLRLEALYDDGMNVWINGTLVVSASMPGAETPYSGVATGAARESASYDLFVINGIAGLLRQGENLIAVQLHNISIDTSSDCFLDARLIAQLGSPNSGPTPGARNSVYDTNVPPAIRQVNHSPEQPKAGEAVTITAKITDPDGISSVQLLYQVVDPGSYIELNDAAYESTWTTIQMHDDGTGGDALAGDDVYTVIIPAAIQTHRRLIRYRIIASDTGNRSVRAPYLDDPQPNFAYFVYNGVPGYQAAIQPGSTDATRSQIQTFSAEEMSRVPSYHLISKNASVETATWYSKYGGDLYQWWGTLVYDGKVYDHIRYRTRGGVWRYAMGKNMWKFDLNRGHDFEPRDNYGKKYKSTWKKLNLGANIQQGDYQHRGEQGMFESVGLRLFNLAGVESPKTHWISLRIIDGSQEYSDQFNGDFWGLYLAVEQEDKRFLDEHDLPDGNFYKMEGGTGELNNQGLTGATDKSDLNAFLNGYRNTIPSEPWWRQNFDVDRYYSYQSIVQGIHHYDICYGKNYFYYLNPTNQQWSVHAWDLDLTWADNMYDSGCGGTDEFKNRLLPVVPFNVEYKNRVREVRDLLFNNDQAWKLIDEYAGIAKGTNGGLNILAADRTMWDYNPVMINANIVNTSKAGQGRFYQFPLESASDSTLKGNFDAVVKIMKNYVIKRSAVLDSTASDTAIPSKPVITYSGKTNFPVNALEFTTSAFSGSGGFGAMKWRIGEIRAASPGIEGIYEITPVWQSPELATFKDRITVPPDALRVGHIYRARVRMKDATDRWSNWSAPMEFTTSEPDNVSALQENLRISEVMYNPPAGNDFEFIELQNISSSSVLQVGGVAFKEGVDFVFPEGASLNPGEFALVVKADSLNDFAMFRQYYGLESTIKVFGPYSGSLNNDGERVTLKSATAGADIVTFAYKDKSGWPVSADGAGHSLVPLTTAVATENIGSLEYGGNWRASGYLGGSPGKADPQSSPLLVINEFAAHTDYANPAKPEYDSNDWIELYNLGSTLPLVDLYLSDDAADLKKWRIPAGTVNAQGFFTFDEVTGFHSPITNGFGLNKAGEELYLSYLPGNSQDRVLDAIHYKGQENGITFGRFPDGGNFFYSLKPTRGTTNVLAAKPMVISEIMYHPPDETNLLDNTWAEFVEIYNSSSETADFYNTNGSYRIDGGISFTFPPNFTLPATNSVLLVSFSPSDSAAVARFKDHYGLQTPGVALLGPYTGKLDNSSDRVALEKPLAADLAGEPLIWVIADEVIYGDQAPWPGADGTGDSLQRLSLVQSGNDPSNWRSALPTPGLVQTQGFIDSDSDGMPDDWETANGLNRFDPADAQGDKDNDGFTNLQEYLSGTNPADPNSTLKLSGSITSNDLHLGFEAIPGKTYRIEYRDDLTGATWQLLRSVTGASGLVDVMDNTPRGVQRFYRIVIPSF